MKLFAENAFMASLPLLVLFGVKLLLAFLVARYAQKRGYSFWLFMIAGGVFSLVTTWIIVCNLPMKDVEELSTQSDSMNSEQLPVS